MAHQRAAIGAAPDDLRHALVSFHDLVGDGAAGIGKCFLPRASIRRRLLWAQPPSRADLLAVTACREVRFGVFITTRIERFDEPIEQFADLCHVMLPPSCEVDEPCCETSGKS